MSDSETTDTSEQSFKRHPKVTFILEDISISVSTEIVEDIHKNFIKDQAMVYETTTEKSQQEEVFTYKTVFGKTVETADSVRVVTMVYLNNTWVSVYTNINTDTNQLETGIFGSHSKNSSRLARDVGQRICKKTGSR